MIDLCNVCPVLFLWLSPRVMSSNIVWEHWTGQNFLLWPFICMQVYEFTINVGIISGMFSRTCFVTGGPCIVSCHELSMCPLNALVNVSNDTVASLDISRHRLMTCVIIEHASVLMNCDLQCIVSPGAVLSKIHDCLWQWLWPVLYYNSTTLATFQAKISQAATG